MDHNIGTLDGKNTFHGIGMVAWVTLAILGTGQIGRPRATTKMTQTVMKKGTPLLEFYGSSIPPIRVKLNRFILLKEAAHIRNEDEGLKDLIWISSWLLKSHSTAYSQWSGYMTVMH